MHINSPAVYFARQANENMNVFIGRLLPYVGNNIHYVQLLIVESGPKLTSFNYFLYLLIVIYIDLGI